MRGAGGNPCPYRNLINSYDALIEAGIDVFLGPITVRDPANQNIFIDCRLCNVRDIIIWQKRHRFGVRLSPTVLENSKANQCCSYANSK